MVSAVCVATTVSVDPLAASTRVRGFDVDDASGRAGWLAARIPCLCVGLACLHRVNRCSVTECRRTLYMAFVEYDFVYTGCLGVMMGRRKA